jgi:hypothetical protein
MNTTAEKSIGLIDPANPYSDLAREAILRAMSDDRQVYLALPDEQGHVGPALKQPRIQPILSESKRAPLLEVGTHVYDPRIAKLGNPH